MDAGSIVALAQASASKLDFERALLRQLMLHIGADVGAFRAGGAGTPTAMGFHPRVLNGDPWTRHARELEAVIGAARTGPAIDTEVMGEGRTRSTRYFSEVVRPHGGRETLFAIPIWQARPAGCLLLGRCGPRGRFGPADLRRLRPLLAAIAVGAAAHAAPAGSRAAAKLSPREVQIVDLLMRGFRSKEIAAALGTSPNTVRNQVSRLMGRVGAGTRAELIAVAARRDG